MFEGVNLHEKKQNTKHACIAKEQSKQRGETKRKSNVATII